MARRTRRARYGLAVGGQAGARDLAHEVWIRAYERADTYVPPPTSPSAAVTAASAEVELWTKGWLRSVARSVFFDQVRHASRCLVPERGTGLALHPKQNKSRRPEDEPADDAAALRARERLKVIFDSIANLPERDRDVVHVSFQWYGPDDQECRIPQEELRYLCKRWGIDEAYIRQIRRRVLKMVEARLAGRSLSLEIARTG